MAIESSAVEQTTNQLAGATLASQGHGTSADVYFITGASRGLGLEMVRQILTTSQTHVVVAAARTPASATSLQGLAAQHPGRVHVIQLDAADEKSIKAAARWVDENLQGRVDVLVNNAGAIDNKLRPWHDVDAADALRVLTTNVLGPLLVSSALLPALRKGHRKTIANISTLLGSVGTYGKDAQTVIHAAHPGPNDDSTPVSDAPGIPPILAAGDVVYKSSKAALNMETLVMARDLAPEGFTVVAVSPGWASTDMGSASADALSQATGGSFKPFITPEQSVSGMLSLLQGLTPRDSGTFYSYDASTLAW